MPLGSVPRSCPCVRKCRIERMVRRNNLLKTLAVGVVYYSIAKDYVVASLYLVMYWYLHRAKSITCYWSLSSRRNTRLAIFPYTQHWFLSWAEANPPTPILTFCCHQSQYISNYIFPSRFLVDIFCALLSHVYARCPCHFSVWKKSANY
jgi:hypothetical protein